MAKEWILHKADGSVYKGAEVEEALQRALEIKVADAYVTSETLHLTIKESKV